MPADRRNALVRLDAHGTAVVHVPPRGRDYFPAGLFCAAPTVLEAINGVLVDRGLPTLYVQPDGTIGPTDPVLMRVEYVPSPFSW